MNRKTHLFGLLPLLLGGEPGGAAAAADHVEVGVLRAKRLGLGVVGDAVTRTPTVLPLSTLHLLSRPRYLDVDRLRYT